MTLFEKFGWISGIDRYLDSLSYDRTTPANKLAIPYKKEDVVWSASNVSICYYLLGNTAKAREYARETTAAVLDYYYGPWKSEVVTRLGAVNVDYWRIHLGWTDDFRCGLCWATSIEDWLSTGRIAEYPIDECKVDTSYTKEDKAVYLALASFLQGEAPERYEHYFDQVRKGKKEKPKLLAEVLRALQEKDSTRFQEALATYLCYFPKREFKKKQLYNLLCMDGTTLLNIGKREGLDFVVPPKAEDHLIRL